MPGAKPSTPCEGDCKFGPYLIHLLSLLHDRPHRLTILRGHRSLYFFFCLDTIDTDCFHSFADHYRFFCGSHLRRLTLVTLQDAISQFSQPDRELSHTPPRELAIWSPPALRSFHGPIRINSWHHCPHAAHIGISSFPRATICWPFHQLHRHLRAHRQPNTINLPSQLGNPPSHRRLHNASALHRQRRHHFSIFNPVRSPFHPTKALQFFLCEIPPVDIWRPDCECHGTTKCEWFLDLPTAVRPGKFSHLHNHWLRRLAHKTCMLYSWETLDPQCSSPSSFNNYVLQGSTSIP